jgi:hypothetical protein
MGRPTASWPALGAALHRLTSVAPPPWVSDATLAAARALLAALRADVERVTAGATRRDAPTRIEAGDGSWLRWKRRGGWLS